MTMSYISIIRNILNVSTWVFLFNSSLFSASNIRNTSKVVSSNGYNNCDFFTNGENYCLSKYLHQDIRVIFDVGANIGNWTSMALIYAPAATVYAFEPCPSIFELLTINMRSYEKVKCLSFGLSDQEKIADFFVWGGAEDIENSGLNGLYNRNILEEIFNRKNKKIQVQLITLDEFCKKNNIDHIDFLKIDTEGNEYFVLLGAEKMISNHQIDIIQFEYGGTFVDSNSTLELIYNFLIAKGYDVLRILPNGHLPITVWDSELENFQYSNYLAIRSNYQKKSIHQ